MLDQELFVDMLQSIHKLFYFDKVTDDEKLRAINELAGYYIYLLAGLDKNIYDGIISYLSANKEFNRDDATALFVCCAEPESHLLS